MSDTRRKWPQLYRQALLESDRTRIPARVDEAHKAIQDRAREFWYAGSSETQERHDLDAAVGILRLLRMVETEK